MKNTKEILYTLSFILFVSCGRNDDSSSNQPPNSFQLLQVTNNSYDVALIPEFTWEAASDPDGDNVSYSLLLDEGLGNPMTEIISNLQGLNYTLIESLENNLTYSWRVIASDGNGGITSSEVFSFTTIENHPPLMFNLLEVLNNETNVNLNPELSWEQAIDPEGDQVTYSVLLDFDIENPTSVIASNLTTTSYSVVNELNRNIPYFWKVIATDSNGNSTESEVFTFKSREIRQTLATTHADFSKRADFGMVEFNGKFWVIGGYSGDSSTWGPTNDVWSSTNGIFWTEEVQNNSPTSFTKREKHTTVVFQNKIWVIGGSNGNPINDVWSSSDGINWVQQTDNAAFGDREDHTSVVFNNRIWVIGGFGGYPIAYDDVWSSSDGINWILETTDSPFQKRFSHSSSVFQNKIWVIGGIIFEGDELNDVWSSLDGINWNLEIDNAPFSVRKNHSTVIYDDRIWVISGDLENDVWSSLDGVNWFEEIAIVDYSMRSRQGCIVYDDKIWIAGGWVGSFLMDVWYLN